MRKTQDLYKNIISRRSIRRYEPDLFREEDLSIIEKSSSSLQSLDSKNNFSIKIFKYKPQAPSGKALGGFGRIMNPPYFMLPVISGDDFSLVDLGFHTQQIVLDLWTKGIGSCYIGCAHRQNRVRQLLGLSEQINIISFLVFGLPDKNQSLRLYQKFSSFFTRAKQRLSIEELFLENSFPESLKSDNLFMKIFEAGRFAPSATNAQPWRFRIEENRFIIFSHQKAVPNLYDLKQGYSLHDTGICMANMSRAAQSLNTEVHWNKANADMQKITTKGIDIPIAYFLMDDLRSKQ
jgi:hypothetical protein